MESKKQGISRATLDRARQRLGIEVKRIPSFDGTFRGNQWSMPQEEPPRE